MGYLSTNDRRTIVKGVHLGVRGITTSNTIINKNEIASTGRTSNGICKL